MHYVYILQSESSGRYYKGYTTNPEHRLQEHNCNLSRYTSGRGPWRMVYLAELLTKREALIEERRLKRLSGRSIERLIGSASNLARGVG